MEKGEGKRIRKAVKVRGKDVSAGRQTFGEAKATAEKDCNQVSFILGPRDRDRPDRPDSNGAAAGSLSREKKTIPGRTDARERIFASVACVCNSVASRDSLETIPLCAVATVHARLEIDRGVARELHPCNESVSAGSVRAWTPDSFEVNREKKLRYFYYTNIMI